MRSEKRALPPHLQQTDDFVRVVNTAAPHSPAGLNQSRPQAGVLRQFGMRMQIRARLPLRQAARAFFLTEEFAEVAHEVQGASQVFAVDHYLNLVALMDFADRPAGQGLRRDMADASAGGDAAEARVGQDGDMLAMGNACFSAEVI